jgi:hypothetical protein
LVKEPSPFSKSAYEEAEEDDEEEDDDEEDLAACTLGLAISF